MRLLVAAAMAAAALGLLAADVEAGAPPQSPAIGLPAQGVLVPGVSLGGIRLGMGRAEVRRVWGRFFGRCRDCPLETWYFTYGPFTQQGAAVAFQRGRVARVYTLWQPPGWRTSAGVELGAAEARVTSAHGPLARTTCGRYEALVGTGRAAGTVFYVYDRELWSFGLVTPTATPCVPVTAPRARA